MDLSVEPAVCENMGENLHEYDMAYISCYVQYGSDVIPDVNFYDNNNDKMPIDYERGTRHIYISTNITALPEDNDVPFECRVRLTQPPYEDSCTTSLDIKCKCTSLNVLSITLVQFDGYASVYFYVFLRSK